MHDPGRERLDYHPAIELLLRYSEDDLRGKEQQSVASHINQCWTCKAQIEEMRDGICAFMEFRETALLPAIPIDPRTASVRDRVLQKAREDSSPFWRELLRPVSRIVSEPRLRPAWIAGALALAVGSVFIFSTAMEPQLMASELLDHVESSLSVDRARERGKVVYQRIRIRRGESTVEREVVRGLAKTPATIRRDETAWAKTLSGPLTWDDPLAADTFNRWRTLQRTRREDVTTAPGLVTLTVVNGESLPGDIRRVSLVVRQSDWHIVGKQVERQNELSVEATEIGYEVWEQAPAGRSFAAKGSVQNDLNVWHDTSHAAINATAAPGKDLDQAEIRTRSALFHLGFGFGGEEIAPSVYRTENALAIRGVVSSAERRNQLQRALAAIPHVIDQVADSVTVPPAGHTTAIAGVRQPTTMRPPQMRQVLVERMGSERSATDFSNEVVADSGKIFALTVLYYELAKRYSGPDMDRSSADYREEVNTLVREIRQELRANLQREAVKLSPILGESSGSETLPVIARQDRAERLFHLALVHDKVVSLLFAVTGGGDSPESGDPGSNPDRLRRVCGEMASLVSPE